MLNLKINWNISEEVKNKIKFIEAISNSKWNINIKWDIKPEFLDSMLIQLVLLDKAKEDTIEFKWVWEKLGFKKNKDKEYTFMDLKWKTWLDGKNWINWKDWKDWLNWIDGFDWKDWENWTSWIDWKDWENWKDWVNWLDWESLEYDIKGNSIGIKLKWERDFKYIRVTWMRWPPWAPWQSITQPLSWNYYATNWSVTPTINLNNWSWDIYEYTLKWVTRYRFVWDTYSPTTDWFYTDLLLTDLIIMRG